MARIIVVDDDEDILDLVAGMLTPEHEVTATTDPARALELIREDAGVDLLVTDIRMPVQNGFMLIRQAKAARPDLQVIVISAYYDETDDAGRQIVHRYAPIALAKPITHAALAKAVATSLSERPLTQVPLPRAS